MKTALISGIEGQDGTYLSELLLKKGYRVFGLSQNHSKTYSSQIAQTLAKTEIIPADLRDKNSLFKAFRLAKPDEVYNLAAQSFVHSAGVSVSEAGDVNALGAIRMLEVALEENPRVRFFQASTSEIFGNTTEAPQTELTRSCPRNPYGAGKLFAHSMVVHFRENLNMFAANGILYNHESPRRGLEFVTRKITRVAAQIKLGHEAELKIGSLDARRDWGFAGDFVEAMWLILQQDIPEDFIIATGQTHSVKDVISIAFEHVGLDWERHVVVDERFVRPTESTQLVGNAQKAKLKLAWEPKTSFKAMIQAMVESDLSALKCQ